MSVRAAFAVFVLLLSARMAAAAPACAGNDDSARGPLMGGAGPADFGTVPEACGATDGALRLRGAVVLAATMPDYYGSIFASATLRGRYQLAERTTLSLAADVFDYRYTNNGGLASSPASAGPVTFAAHQMVVLGSDTAASLYARALLPLDTARHGVQTGLELGAAARVALGERWAVDGGLALAAPLDVIGGQAHLRLEPAALAEAWLRLRPAIALCGGVNLRVIAAPAFELRTLVPRLGARFAIQRRWWTALLAELPVAGSDPTDLIAGLYAGFTP